MAAVSDDWVDDHLDLIVALRSLPRRQSEVLALHHMLGYTLTETAEILQIDKLTVKTHLYRALARLRQQGHQTQPEPTELGGRIR
jgi:RNA polymerase sigma-70 factor (ECF subfamily)